MIKCLVTGGNGNLGMSLQDIEGWQTYPVGRNDWGNADSLFSRGLEMVVHAAGSLNKPITAYPTEYIDSNVLALMKTLELMKKYRVPRIFFISSCAVYGISSQTAESGTLSPISLNGHAKLLCEKVLEEYCMANGIEYVILRVFNIFGGADRFSVLHHLHNAIANATPFKMNNNGQAQRDFVHVDDVANVIFKLAQIPNLPHAINVGSGVAIKISEVVNRFRQLNPELKILANTCHEAEYSRADITLLNSIINYKFRSIFDSIVCTSA